MEIERTRTTFGMTETQKELAPCVVDCEQVQTRVNTKYDAWQRGQRDERMTRADPEGA